MQIHTRLKNIREDRDIQQKDVCEALGIVQPHYSRYERGINEVPVRHIIKLAEFYNLSADYLLCLIEEPRPLHPEKSSQLDLFSGPCANGGF